MLNVIENTVLKKIWEDRYQKNGETLDGNYHRVAKYIANNENEENEFYNVISEGLLLPAGRTMSNAGIGDMLTLNNCFVAPQVQDDLKEIFNSVKLGAITHKSGGGIGYDFSAIRPNGMPTSNDAVASGPVSFMEVFDAQTSTILQGNRRGANMGVLNVYHPDIEEFINVKSTSGKLTHFNLSVMVDNAFMQAVENNEYVTLHFPVYDNHGKILKDSTKWKMSKKVSALDIWDKIMRLAYNNGEPGIFFYDNMNSVNNLWYAENIVCSNPCSEYLAGTVYDVDNPEQYGGACNLGSLILPNFVDNPFTKNAMLDLVKLEDAVCTGVRMLDNIIDINKFPDEIYENYQKRFRTIGLGYTGLADMLAMLNMRYDTEEARKYVDSLTNLIANMAYRASAMLAKEKGRFPGWDDKFLESKYVTNNLSDATIGIIKKYGIRNSKILAIAPTGTMSLTFGNNCSSGVEPIFSLEYDRKVKIGGQQDDNIEIVKMRDYAYDQWLKFKDNPECIVTKDVFVTALNISVDDHVDMLAAVAENIDMSVSKTINVPENYSFEDTKDIYMKCWKSGIKGCTIFRPNEIRQGILIDDSSKNNKQNDIKENTVEALSRGMIITVSDDLIGKKRKLQTGCGSLHCSAFFDPATGDLMETYLSKGSTGGCDHTLTGLSRMISLAARAGCDIHDIVDQLNSTGSCASYAVRRAVHKDTSKGACCPMAVGNAILDMYNEMQSEITCDEDFEETEELYANNTKVAEIIFKRPTETCPECGEELIFEGGCCLCKSCGYSRCS